MVAHAAELLNMRRTTLVEKMRKYGLQRAGFGVGCLTLAPMILIN